MTRTLFILALLALTIAAPARAASDEDNGVQLVNNLIDCRPWETAMDIDGQVITLKVHGEEKDGTCKLTQTMPDHGLQTCLISKEQRLDIVKNGHDALMGIMGDEDTCTISTESADAADKE